MLLRKSSLFSRSLYSLLLIAAGSRAQEASNGVDRAPDFKTWARANAVLIEPEADDHDSSLRSLVDGLGPASIIGFGEPVHAAAQPLEFRNRLFKYLISHHRIEAVAIESGIIEGQLIDAYIHGSPIDRDRVLREGFSWTFGDFPQNADLIDWLRAYNQDAPPERRVRFYGFDVPGSVGNPNPGSSPDVGLEAALAYLKSVDPQEETHWRQQFARFRSYLRFDFGQTSGEDFSDLTAESRLEIQRMASSFQRMLEHRKAGPTESGDALVWARMSATAFTETLNSLMQIPEGWRQANASLSSKNTMFMRMIDEKRDRAQALNVEWILRHEGQGKRLALFAHRYHLNKDTVRMAYSNGRRSQWMEQRPAGNYLAKWHGADFVNIAGFSGSGTAACGSYARSYASHGDFDTLLEYAARAPFFLNLKRVTGDAREYLLARQRIGDQDDALETRPRDAFDGLVYLGALTPACP